MLKFALALAVTAAAVPAFACGPNGGPPCAPVGGFEPVQPPQPPVFAPPVAMPQPYVPPPQPLQGPRTCLRNGNAITCY
jgi:hypothetical protein